MIQIRKIGGKTDIGAGEGNLIVEPTKFYDGTFRLSIPRSWSRDSVLCIDWFYDDESELALLQYVMMYLHEKGLADIHLNMPYIPNARMDRATDSEVFTLKYFARIINSLNFSQVTVLDPHSNVSTALINRVKATTPNAYLYNVLTDIENRFNAHKKILICFSDAGAAKRYKDLDALNGLDYIYGAKTRDPNDKNHIKTLVLYHPSGERVKSLDPKTQILIVDDICSKGGTFEHTAKACREAGAEIVSLWVTHCEKTVLKPSALYEQKAVNHIYTTNSIFPYAMPNMTVYDVLKKTIVSDASGVLPTRKVLLKDDARYRNHAL